MSRKASTDYGKSRVQRVGEVLFSWHPPIDPSLVEPDAAVPREFLFSWHKPYNEWMDTPVRVYYNKVPLDEIFENSPFTRLSYRFIEKPEEMPLVSADTMGISRRQLLWAIAHDYNLHMSLKSLPNGHPSEVIIRWRGDNNTRTGTIDSPDDLPGVLYEGS